MAFKVSSIFLIKKLKKLKKGICAPTIKHFDIIKIATPLYISTLMQFFANQADIWIIAAFASVSEVAYYGAAARLVLLLTVPWMVANAVIQPIIAELWTKDQFKKLEKLLQTVANITFVLGIIPTLIFVFWGSHIMGHLFGEYYRNGSMVLCILSIGQIANLAACPSGVMLIMGGKQKGLMTITIISALSFLSISFFGIFKYGPLAVATAATFSAFIRQLLMAYYCKKTLNIKTYIGKNW
jgi:O-antigen/teichoic acid export membrane protein